MKKRHEIRCPGNVSRNVFQTGIFNINDNAYCLKEKSYLAIQKFVVKWKTREFVSPENIRFF